MRRNMNLPRSRLVVRMLPPLAQQQSVQQVGGMQRIPSSATIGVGIPPPPVLAGVTTPMYARFDALISSLTDSTKRDDLKYKDLREISENFEELTTNQSCAPLIDSLIRAFIRLLHETTPQFISENNTLQLRKLVFELMLRLTTSESMKTYTKMVQTLLLRIMIDENEENALLIVKILSDHLKMFRPHFFTELVDFFNEWKNAFRDMLRYASQDRMFLNPDYFEANTRTIEDFGVPEALDSCFIITLLSFKNVQPSNLKYSLIPRAKQSVRVLAEMTTFILVLIQAHCKQQQQQAQVLIEHLGEFIPLFVRYAEVTVPKHIRSDKSYSKELVDEFHNSQIRALTYIAYTARQPQYSAVGIVEENSAAIVNGIKNLFDNLHGDVIHHRRDLLILIKYYFQCPFDMKTRLIEVIPQLMSESLLIGTSFTSRDQLRAQAFTLLADILHHCRLNLPFKLLTHVFFFSIRCLHDSLLQAHVQTMYGKLIYNLIELLVNCEKQDDEERKQVNDILVSAVESYVRKAIYLTEYHLPLIREKYRFNGPNLPSAPKNAAKTNTAPSASEANSVSTSDQAQQSNNNQQEQPTSTNPSSSSGGAKLSTREDFLKSGDSEPAPSNGFTRSSDSLMTKKPVMSAAEYSVLAEAGPMALNDFRNMMKFIFNPLKLLVTKLREANPAISQKVIDLMFKFFVHGLKCLDVYTIIANSANPYQKNPVRSKDEKELTDLFIATYACLDPAIFCEIVEENVDFFVERISQSAVLQSVCNTTLMQIPAGPKIGGVLVKYLLKHLPEMGSSNEHAVQYLKLFKLTSAAGSYSQVNSESGNVLTPYVSEILQESMRLALTSRESINYFWLLRALFRSIGSGAHDLLYQQFLPQLPSILQQLNRLQNSAHQQSTHELFAELCLTVPVRLSSLLPYLPLLMDPLVCSMHGTSSLIQQGLRTLELCVDNLQPEYFYDHMYPVRASLLQGLWRTVSSADQQTALSAFRILGKFGGSTRKVLLDARNIDFKCADPDETKDPAMLEIMTFRRRRIKQEGRTSALDNEETEPVSFRCELTLQELVDGATAILNLAPSADLLPVSNVIGAASLGYASGVSGIPRLQALEIVKSVLCSAINSTNLSQMSGDQLKEALSRAVQRSKDRKANGVKLSWKRTGQPTPEFVRTRRLYSSALAGLFYAVVNNELKPHCFTMFKDLIKYFTLQSFLQISDEDVFDDTALSSLPIVVLVDAMKLALADSCKDYCHAAVASLKFMVDTARAVFGTETTCDLPQFDYVLEQLSLLCFRSEWFVRLGGCTALRFFLEDYPASFVHRHASTFLNSFTEIAAGLADEVSFGALDYAAVSTDILLSVCFPTSENGGKFCEEMLHYFLSHVIERLSDAEAIVRKEAFRILDILATRTKQSKAQLFERFNTRLVEILTDSIKNFSHLSMENQIGVLEMYVLLANQSDLALDWNAIDSSDFIRNLLVIVDPSQERLLSQLRTSCGEVAPSSAKPVAKFFLLRRAANDVLTVWCRKNIDKSSEMELEKQTFSMLLNNALLLEFNLSDQFKTAIEKIVTGTNPSSFCRTLILENVTKIFHTANETFSIEQVKQLLFLTRSISTEQLSDENIARLKTFLNTILAMEQADVKSVDVEFLLHIIQLFYQVDHQDLNLLKSSLLFLMLHEDKLRYMKEPWLGIIARFSSLNAANGGAVFFIDEAGRDSTSMGALGLSHICVGILEHENGTELKKILLEKSSLLCDALKSVMEEPEFCSFNFVNLSASIRSCMSKIQGLLKITWKLIESDAEWFATQDGIKLFDMIRRLWTNQKFREIFWVRREYLNAEAVTNIAELMETSKYNVPVYCANVLIARLRHLLTVQSDSTTETNDSETIDILFDLTYAFSYSFVSEFSFVRAFIDNELIPKVSLQWRRNAFKKIINMLKGLEMKRKETGIAEICEEQPVRFMQFVVVPSFFHAFENFSVDAVIGSTPEDIDRGDQNNLMSDLISYIDIICPQNTSNKSTHCMSDSMTIVIYHFCVLLVQNCPLHIHDMSKKPDKTDKSKHQEGNRLRSFMLFGWPCLQANYLRDLTEKYSGHLLIANIIDKFAINRKIVLQVLNSLVSAHHQDHKEIVRKALDILVPAVPRRMDDGHLQLFTIIKKVILEENRNASQVALHCLNIVIRHHKVFYFVRHELSRLILNTLQRILGSQYGYESRRLVLDICDVFVKWEQECQRIIGFNETSNVAGTSTAAGLRTSASQSSIAESNDGGHSRLDPTASSGSNSPNTVADPSNKTVDNLHQPMDKAVVDEVIYLLVKTAIASAEPSGSPSTTHEQLNKRSILLFRIAMKPNVFGNVATLRPQWFEKHLIVPSHEQVANDPSLNQHYSQIQITLDFFTNTIVYMPQTVVLNLFRSIQHKLIDCLSSASSVLVRSTFSVVNRLFEKCNAGGQGLVEFEALNAFVAKYIHDNFSSYYNSMIASVQPTLLAITLLRSLHNIQPAYLETVCLNPFLKMVQRLVRDYQAPPLTVHSSKPPESNQKFFGDALCVCLEILCSRTKHLSFEAKRSIAQLILIPLIEKGAADKVLEALVKIVHELVIDNGDSRSSFDTQSGGGLINLGVGLLIRMCISLEARLTTNAEMLCMFLESVLFVFESDRFKGLSDITSKLNAAFFWGMSCNDHSIRNRCFNVLEKYFPRDPYHRLIYIFTKQNWQSFGNYFWISHVVHLLLLSNGLFEKNAASPPTEFALKNCRTFSQFTERLIIDAKSATISASTNGDAMDTSTVPNSTNVEVKVEEQPVEASTQAITTDGTVSSEMVMEVDPSVANDKEQMDVTESKDPNTADSKSQNSEKPTEPGDKAWNDLFYSYNNLLQTAASNQLDAVVDNVMDYLHYDWRVAKHVFLQLFRSCWAQLDSYERADIGQYAQAFLSSMGMMPQKGSQISSAAVFLEAFSTCDPPVHFTAPLFSYIGSTHNYWHYAVLLLEREAVNIRLNNDSALKNSDAQPNEQLEILENLALLYENLNEPDQLWMVWKRRCCFNKTTRALALYNQGEFAHAQDLFEKMTAQIKDRIANKSPRSESPSSSPFIVTPSMRTEISFWEKYWINSCKELSDWSTLANFANDAEISDPALLMESAWHLGEWPAVGECAFQVDACANPKLYTKSALYKAMLTVKKFDLNYKEAVDRSLIDISKHLIAEWRSLPRIVSTSHIGLLIDAHLLHEVQEANSTLISSTSNTSPGGGNNMKHVMKSWRSRSLTQVDPLSAWNCIFNWRYQHYTNIMKEQQLQNTFLLHSLTQSQLTLAHALRRSGQIENALNELHTLHTFQTILPTDGHMKVVEEIKCLMKLASGSGDPTGKLSLTPTNILEEALHTIEDILPEIPKKERASRLMFLKGTLLSRLDRRDEASALFKETVNEEKAMTGSNSLAVWKSWGCHMEKFFLSNPVDANASNFGIQALVCFFECAKLCSYLKSRPHISRIFWLIKMIASAGSSQCLKTLEDTLKVHVSSVTLSNWLFWLDEIICDIRQRSDASSSSSSSAMSDLLCSIAETYPQQTFYAMRLAVGSTDIDRRLAQLAEKSRTFVQWSAQCKSRSEVLNWDTEMDATVSSDENGAASAETAFPPDWCKKCLSAVDALYMRQPVNITHLNELLNELDNFKPLPLETLLCKLRDLHDICNDYEFANISDLAEAKPRKDILQKLVQVNEYLETASRDSSDSFYMILSAIRSEFTTILNGENKNLRLIASSVRRALAAVVQTLRFETENKPFFMRDTSTVLDRFKNKIALIDIFYGHTQRIYSGSSLKHGSQTVQVAQFFSTYHVFSRQDGVRRLLQVRALNGKVYSFFLERVNSNTSHNYIYQLFTMLNSQFAKDRGMCQRLMQIPIPRSQAIGERSRIVECCPISGTAHHFRTTPADARDALDELAFHNFLDIFDRMFRGHRKELDDTNHGSGNDGVPASLAWPADSWSGSLEVVDHYYNRLAEQRYCHKTLFDVFNEISRTAVSNGASSDRFSVPKDLLKRWMEVKYSDPSSYWIVRRNLSMSFALLGIIEHALFLSPIQLDGLYLDLSTSQLFYGDYRFDLSKKFGEKAGSKVSIIELDGNRPVGFRVSSNIAHFLELSIEGHVSGAILATAKCLNHVPVERLLRPLLWDVFYDATFGVNRCVGASSKSIANASGESDTAAFPIKDVVSPVERALETILNRIKSYIPNISQVERAQALLHLDSSHHADNLCRMDPSWHPWF